MCWNLSAVRHGWSTPPRATTNPAWKRRLFSWDDRTVCVGADKSEHWREFKEMNFEQKMNNPLAHFLAARLFLNRLTQLIRGREIPDFSRRFESDQPP
jgi:hypothetical protein